MSEPTFVYDENIEKLENEVARLNRRAAKLGVPSIQLRVGEVEKVEINDQQHLRASCTLTGAPPTLAGWTFEASIDHLSNGLITSYPGSTLDLKPFRGVDATCDHCQVKRNRHETFIVRHAADASVQRVGRTCLADFLGHHGNPSALIGHLNLWGKAFEALEGAEAAGTGAATHTLALASFVAFVSQEIRNAGWLSRGKAYENGGQATADVAQNAYWDRSHYTTLPTQEDNSKALGAIAWARTLTDEQVEDNDYLYNLRAVCQDDYIRPKRGGLAGSVLVAAGRAFEKAQRAANNVHVSNDYVGSLKERLTLDLKLVNLRRFEGYYGVSFMHTFEDASGNALIWFASNPTIVRDGKGKRDMVVGETIKLAGTVKKQEEYRGRKQTTLSRVSHPKGK